MQANVYNTMIDGWLQAGRLDEAMAVVETIRARGVVPNTTTVLSMLRGALAAAGGGPDAAATTAAMRPGKPVEDVLDQLLQLRAPALLRGSIWADSFFTPDEAKALEAAITEWANHPHRSPVDRDAVLQGGSAVYPFELPFENAVRPGEGPARLLLSQIRAHSHPIPVRRRPIPPPTVCWWSITVAGCPANAQQLGRALGHDQVALRAPDPAGDARQRDCPRALAQPQRVCRVTHGVDAGSRPTCLTTRLTTRLTMRFATRALREHLTTVCRVADASDCGIATLCHCVRERPQRPAWITQAQGSGAALATRPCPDD